MKQDQTESETAAIAWARETVSSISLPPPRLLDAARILLATLTPGEWWAGYGENPFWRIDMPPTGNCRDYLAGNVELRERGSDEGGGIGLDACVLVALQGARVAENRFRKFDSTEILAAQAWVGMQIAKLTCGPQPGDDSQEESVA